MHAHVMPGTRSRHGVACVLLLALASCDRGPVRTDIPLARGAVGPDGGRVKVDMVPELVAKNAGRLQLVTHPWTQVTLDGAGPAMATPLTVDLDAGHHVMLLVNERESVRKEVPIDLAAGQVLRLDINMVAALSGGEAGPATGPADAVPR